MPGTPFHSTKPAANGSRKVKRPHTLMYSSRECPSRFITVLRSTWHRAATSARTSHMGAGLARARQERRERVDHRARLLAGQEVPRVRHHAPLGALREAGEVRLRLLRAVAPVAPAVQDHARTLDARRRREPPLDRLE